MALQVGVGVSTEKDPLLAAREAANQAQLNLHSERIDLALVFTSAEFAHSNFLKIISSLIGPVTTIGCSGFGVITHHGIAKTGLAIMLLRFSEEISFNAACIKDVNQKSGFSVGKDLADALTSGLKSTRRNFSIILSDGLTRDLPGILEGLGERLGKSFPLFGASSSDNLTYKKTFQYFENELLTDAICGMIWGGRVNFGIGIQHGWKPLGKPRDVTKSSGNVVFEIDGQPAVNIYKEYFGLDPSKLRKELKRICVFYPFGIYLAGEDEYLLRNLLSIEENGALVFQGNIPQNSSIRLMIGTKESCLEAVTLAANQVKRALSGRPCNFVIVFASVSRYILLGRQAHKEVQIIKDVLGNIPVIGIYTYGEQAPLQSVNYQGITRFHNQSIALLGIGS